MKDLLTKVKQEGQDFEWYPTTKEMLFKVALDILSERGRESSSILDIGAGNGSALNIIEDFLKEEEISVAKYAIEKSKILIDSLPSDIFVVGTDFHQQTLIDKEVDVIFCNPPYSEYEVWAERIIAEANAELVYLVIPKRWRENKIILSSIESRTNREVESLGEFTFENSEFRQARAIVEIIRVNLKEARYMGEKKVDPFDLWFKKNFNFEAPSGETSSEYYKQEARRKEIRELVRGQNIIERLEELYIKDFGKLLNNYKSLEGLDADLFKKLGIELSSLKKGLQLKIKGLKNLYWKELFSNLDSITERLTSKSREKMLTTLNEHTAVDYSSSNAYAVVIWAIKNANNYFDEQLKTLYLELADKENIRNYKSNTKFVEDGWRYNKWKQTHFTLDYRIILDKWECFSPNSWSSYKYPNNLSERVHEVLGDICTIGKNLGFDIKTSSKDIEWSAGQLEEFYMGGGELFMDVRCYKKGTVHIRFNQEFIKKLNIEAGRLNGWIKSPKEATEEMGIENSEDYFGSNYKMKSIKLLTD